MQFNLWSVYYHVFIWCDLVPTSPWGKLHPVPTAMLTVSKISIQATFYIYLRHTVFIGNQSAWFWCIIIESGIFLWWVSRGGGLHVSEDRRISRREDEKRKRETGTPFHTMGAGGGGCGATRQKVAHFPPSGKKFTLPHGKNSSVSRLPLPVLPNTKFLFPQTSKPKPLN